MSRAVLTPESYTPYLNAPVGNYLVAPAVPNAGELVLNELTSPEDISKRAKVRAYDETTGMALIDKRFAHAVREVMWLHVEETPIATLSDYISHDQDGSKTRSHFAQMAECAVVAETQSDYVSLSWSSDPDTYHRPSIQGEKRLHFHLTSRNGELDALPEVTTSVSNLNFIDRRRLAEEYSFVTTAFLTDVIEERPELGIKTTPIHPCVLSLEVGDWPDLATPMMLKKISTFLNMVEGKYGEIANCIGGEDEFGRVDFSSSDPYDCIKDVSGLGESSSGLALLASYVSALKVLRQRRNGNAPLPAVIGDNVKGTSKHLYTALTPSKGLSYAGNFSKYDDTLYFHFRPCKFSDLGGAGCAFLHGMPVRVKKGTDPMSCEQMDRREQFVAQNVAIVTGGGALQEAAI